MNNDDYDAGYESGYRDGLGEAESLRQQFDDLNDRVKELVSAMREAIDSLRGAL